MLISKENLALLEGCGNESPFDHARIFPGEYLEVTNTYSLYRSTLPSIPVEEFPETHSECVSGKECISVPARHLEKAAKNIPKSHMLVLEHLNLVSDEEYHHLVATNLDTIDDVKFQHSPVEWFNTDTLDNTRYSAPKVAVILGVAQLEILVKILKKQKKEYVYMELRGDTGPIYIESDDTSGFLMPYKY